MEIYHALTDGVGALQFLRILVVNYLTIEHSDVFKGQVLTIDYDASIAEKEADSFKKHFYKGKSTKKIALGMAHKIRGEKFEGDRLQVIRGVVSVKAVLQEAHKYHTTLTVFLASLLIYSIGKEMSMKDKKRPVVLSVPVNLRPYFQSASARNFFSVINVAYHFDEEEMVFENIIKYLQEFFERELTTEKLRSKLNKLVSLEHNYFTRVIPLFLKKPTLRFAHYMNNKEVTSVLSNIGKVSMPSELEPYIELFDVCVSTNKIQMCICSYKDKLSLNFTSPFISAEVQKNFFRELSTRNIEVYIATNIGEKV